MTIQWITFEDAFASLYSKNGRLAKPMRLMAGLQLLKQLENLGDEIEVQKWAQNIYDHYFCRMAFKGTNSVIQLIWFSSEIASGKREFISSFQ